MLVSHDRHLLRATTDQFLVVAEGGVREFDGDLEDYRDWLLKRDAVRVSEKKIPAKKPKPADRKPLESRIKRLEEMMARLNAKKVEVEARLASPAVYQDPEALKNALHDQAYVARELEQAEAEWLQKQGELERS